MQKSYKVSKAENVLDCRTVRFFAYSCTREQSNKHLEARALPACETLKLRLTDFEKKNPTVLQSKDFYVDHNVHFRDKVHRTRFQILQFDKKFIILTSTFNVIFYVMRICTSISK